MSTINSGAVFFLKEMLLFLGTITAKGGDVYSYDEDDMVEDPDLAKHLSHWGINMMNMEKTDQSMADLEINLNQKYGEASMIEEANSNLKPVHGAGKFLFVLFRLFTIMFRIYGNEKFRKFMLYEFCITSFIYNQRFPRKIL